MTNIATAERAEIRKQLKDLRLDEKAVAGEVKTIDTNERTALRMWRAAERELRREHARIQKRRKSLTRECNAARKGAARRGAKIAMRIAILKGRLA